MKASPYEIICINLFKGGMRCGVLGVALLLVACSQPRLPVPWQPPFDWLREQEQKVEFVDQVPVDAIHVRAVQWRISSNVLKELAKFSKSYQDHVRACVYMDGYDGVAGLQVTQNDAADRGIIVSAIEWSRSIKLREWPPKRVD